MRNDDDVVGTIRQALAELAPKLSGKPSSAVTEALTSATEASLRMQGYRVFREWNIAVPWGRGRLDLAALPTTCAGRRIAIELDRSNKQRSIKKLSFLAKGGQLALWIRWGHRLPSRRGEVVPAGISVIEVPLWFRRAPLPPPVP